MLRALRQVGLALGDWRARAHASSRAPLTADRARAALAEGWRAVESLERVPPAVAGYRMRTELRAQKQHAAATLPRLRRWDAVPARPFRVYTAAADQVRLRRILDFIAPGDRVLDIGAGHGYLTGVILRDSPASYYCGIDLGPKIVESARQMVEVNQLADQMPYHLEQKDLYTLSPEWTAPHNPDLLVCCEVLEHVPDAEAALRTIAGAMPPRASLLFSVPLLGRLEKCWGHVSLFDSSRIRAMVEQAGLHAHFVEPLYNTWVLVLASPSHEPPARLEPVLAAHPVAATPDPVEDPTFRRVSLSRARALPVFAPAGTRTDLRRDSDGLRVTVTAAAGAAGAGGVSLPVPAVRIIRLEVAVPTTGVVRGVEVCARDADRLVGRWRWRRLRLPRMQDFPTAMRTFVLRPGEPEGPFRPVGRRWWWRFWPGRGPAPGEPAYGEPGKGNGGSVELRLEVEPGQTGELHLRRLATVG